MAAAVRVRRTRHRSTLPRHRRPRHHQPARESTPQGRRSRHHHLAHRHPRLLPRLLAGRRTGPVFLTDRRARAELAPIDLDPATGRARLSYRRAAELFERASAGATLHQLRHSALTHAAEDGANTAVLLSYSGHISVTSLARYTRISAEALTAWQAERDPATRRR